jgi:Uma2 family endonuclease
VPPDIAIEVVSPEPSLSQQRTRCQWFVEHGVELAAVIDPGTETVAVFRPGADARILSGGDRVDFGDVVPGFQPTVEEIFDLLSLNQRQFSDL